MFITVFKKFQKQFYHIFQKYKELNSIFTVRFAQDTNTIL